MREIKNDDDIPFDGPTVRRGSIGILFDRIVLVNSTVHILSRQYLNILANPENPKEEGKSPMF